MYILGGRTLCHDLSFYYINLSDIGFTLNKKKEKTKTNVTLKNKHPTPLSVHIMHNIDHHKVLVYQLTLCHCIKKKKSTKPC